MDLGEKIVAERKKTGMTQQQLATATNLTVRTIQRIENGASLPRPFTITAIATALGTTYQALYPNAIAASVQPQHMAETTADQKNFLQLLTLSCFSYLVIPFIHFLIPLWVRQKSKIKGEEAISFGRKIIRNQIIWTVATNLLMLLTLAFNLVSTFYWNKIIIINYLFPFFLMYVLNAIILAKNMININRKYH